MGMHHAAGLVHGRTLFPQLVGVSSAKSNSAHVIDLGISVSATAPPVYILSRKPKPQVSSPGPRISSNDIKERKTDQVESDSKRENIFGGEVEDSENIDQHLSFFGDREVSDEVHAASTGNNGGDVLRDSSSPSTVSFSDMGGQGDYKEPARRFGDKKLGKAVSTASSLARRQQQSSVTQTQRNACGDAARGFHSSFTVAQASVPISAPSAASEDIGKVRVSSAKETIEGVVVSYKFSSSGNTGCKKCTRIDSETDKVVNEEDLDEMGDTQLPSLRSKTATMLKRVSTQKRSTQILPTVYRYKHIAGNNGRVILLNFRKRPWWHSGNEKKKLVSLPGTTYTEVNGKVASRSKTKEGDKAKENYEKSQKDPINYHFVWEMCRNPKRYDGNEYVSVVLNHVENNRHLVSKKNLYFSIRDYCSKVGRGELHFLTMIFLRLAPLYMF